MPYTRVEGTSPNYLASVIAQGRESIASEKTARETIAREKTARETIIYVHV